MASVSSIMAGAAFVKLSLDDKALLDGLERSQDKIKRYCFAVRQYGTQMASFGALAAMPVKNALDAFADFELKMRQVRVMTNASEDSMRGLMKLTRDLGRTTSYTTSQIAAGMVEFARAGFSMGEIRNSIKPAMDLAMATGSELTKSIQVAANAIRSFGLETTGLSRVSDVITATVNSSTQTLEDFAEAFHKASPIFNQAGYDISELSAAIGVLANLGIKGSIAGTGLARAVQQISKQSVRKVFKEEANIDVEYGGKLRKITDIFRDMAVHMRSLSSEAEQNEFVQRTLGIIGGRTGMPMISQFEKVDELLKKINSSMGISARSANEMEQTTYGALQRISSALNDVSIHFGELLSSSIVNEVEALAMAMNSLAGSTGLLGGAARGLVQLVSVLAGLGGMVYVFSKVIDLLKLLNRPMKASVDFMLDRNGAEKSAAFKERKRELMRLSFDKGKEVDAANKAFEEENASLRAIRERLDAQKQVVKSIEEERAARREEVRESDRRMARIQEEKRRESKEYSARQTERYGLSAENRKDIIQRKRLVSKAEDRIAELKRQRSIASRELDVYKKSPDFARYKTALSVMKGKQESLSAKIRGLDEKKRSRTATSKELADLGDYERQYRAITKSLDFAREKAIASVDMDAMDRQKRLLNDIDAKIKTAVSERIRLVEDFDKALKKYNVDDAKFRRNTREHLAASAAYSEQLSAEKQVKIGKESDVARLGGELKDAGVVQKDIEKEYKAQAKVVEKRNRELSDLTEQRRNIESNILSLVTPEGITKSGIERYRELSEKRDSAKSGMDEIDRGISTMTGELSKSAKELDNAASHVGETTRDMMEYVSSPDVRSMRGDIARLRELTGDSGLTVGQVSRKEGEYDISRNRSVQEAMSARDRRVAELEARRTKSTNTISSYQDELSSGKRISSSRRKVIVNGIRNSQRVLADIDKAIDNANEKYLTFVDGIRKEISDVSDSLKEKYFRFRQGAKRRGNAMRYARKNAEEISAGIAERERGIATATENRGKAYGEYMGARIDIAKLMKSDSVSAGFGATVRALDAADGSIMRYIRNVSSLSGVLSNASVAEMRNAVAIRKSGVEYKNASASVKMRSTAVAIGTKALASSFQLLGSVIASLKSYMLSFGVSFIITKVIEYYNKVINEGVERTERLIDRLERLNEVVSMKRADAVSKATASYNDIAILRSLGAEGPISVSKYELASQAVERLRTEFKELEEELKDVDTARKNVDRIADVVRVRNVSSVRSIDEEAVRSRVSALDAAVSMIYEKAKRGDAGYRMSLFESIMKDAGLRKYTARTRDDSSGTTFDAQAVSRLGQYSVIGKSESDRRSLMLSWGYDEYDKTTGKWYKYRNEDRYGFENIANASEEQIRKIIEIVDKYLNRDDVDYGSGSSKELVSLSDAAKQLLDGLEALRQSRAGNISVNPNRVYSESYPGAMPDEKRERGLESLRKEMRDIEGSYMTDSQKAMREFDENVAKNISFLDSVIDDYASRIRYYQESYKSTANVLGGEQDRGRRRDLYRKLMTTRDNILHASKELNDSIIPMKRQYEEYVKGYRGVMDDKERYRQYRNTEGEADDVIRSVEGVLDKTSEELDAKRLFGDVTRLFESGRYDDAMKKAKDVLEKFEDYAVVIRDFYYSMAKRFADRGLFSNDGRMGKREKDSAMADLSDILSLLRMATENYTKASGEIMRMSSEVSSKIRGITDSLERYGIGARSSVGQEEVTAGIKREFLAFAERLKSLYNSGRRPGDSEYDETAKRLLQASTMLERQSDVTSNAGTYEQNMYGKAMRPFLLSDYGSVTERTLEKRISSLENSLESYGNAIDRMIRNKFGGMLVEGGAYNRGESSMELNAMRAKAAGTAVELDKLYRQREALKRADRFADRYSFFSNTSFSAKELDALGFEGTQERIAKSTEGVERNTRVMVDQMRQYRNVMYSSERKASTWSE